MNRAFSRIWIVVTVIILLAGGILAWQYWWIPKEEIKVAEEITRRDAVRKLQMREIVTYQELYYGNNDQYYQSVSYPSDVFGWTDPKTGDSYGWTDNTRNSQRFCAYAKLEKGGFYIAFHSGNKEVAMGPLTLSDCEQFAEVKSKRDGTVMSTGEYMQKAEKELIEAKKFLEEDDILEASNHIAQAIDYAKLATDSDPNNPEMWFRLGSIYCEVKDTVQDAEEWCLKSYQKALGLDPDNSLYRQKVEEITK